MKKPTITDYALQEYALVPAEMAKAEKRIARELKHARKRGALTGFKGALTFDFAGDHDEVQNYLRGKR